ncbi:MAG: Beta-lactamase protein [uncultured bacterium]|nr:MAG: Beta-lactamase protein [uncultured bacterium]
MTVYYSAVNSSLHVSGHAALEELRLMVNLIKPKYLFPIGGTYRHMEAFSKMAQDMGYDKKQILPAEDGDIIEIRKDDIKLAGKVEVQNVYVDGLGIGDVGHVVLRDRQKMSEEGVVVVVVSMDSHTGRLVSDVDVISRGFVFEEMAKDLLEDAKRLVKETLEKHTHKSADWRFDRKIIEDVLEKFLYKATERRPLILPIIVEV